MTPAIRHVILNNSVKSILNLHFSKQIYSKLNQNFSSISDLPGFSFTRASSKTALTSSGAFISFAPGVPAITDQGILIEESRTNLFLNSFAPATQTITLAATGNYTISVWGTGSVTIAAGTATITNGGAVTSAATRTINCTAIGTITCTVSGSPTAVQVEAGAFGTSPIQTAGTTVTRAADALSISPLTVPTISTAFIDALGPTGVSTDARIFFTDGSTSNRIGWIHNGSQVASYAQVAAVSQNGAIGVGVTPNTRFKSALSYDGTTWREATNGSLLATTTGSTPAASLTSFTLMNTPSSQIRFWNNYIRRIVLYSNVQSVTGLTQ